MDYPYPCARYLFRLASTLTLTLGVLSSSILTAQTQSEPTSVPIPQLKATAASAVQTSTPLQPTGTQNSLGQQTQTHQTTDLPCVPPSSLTSEQGEITIGCPKIWGSEHVFTVLDGILRDVDSITVKALQDLDPNAANAALVESLVTEFQANVKFSQADLANNALKQEQIKQLRQNDLTNFKAMQDNNATLRQTQTLLQQQLLDIQKTENDLVAAGKTDDDPQMQAIQKRRTNLLAELDSVNKEIQTPTIADQSLTGTSAADLSTTPLLTNARPLPDSLKNALTSLLGTPSLPASMRMDNVVELLHQRLAREFSVMYDDLVRQRDKYDIYLVQFDIGVLPKHDAKDRYARVNIYVDPSHTIPYELYPSASAYNLMRGQDKTSRIGITGAVQTLVGLGLTAAFNRERNEVHSGLSQSMFISGFGIGTNKFGWMIGPAPFENFIQPGNRIVHAVILVPRNTDTQKTITVSFNVKACWPERETRYQWPWGHDDECQEGNAEDVRTINIELPRPPSLQLLRASYNPIQVQPITTAGNNTPDDTNTVFLALQTPIDPNLIITANDQLIRRVRDVRGRALFGGITEALAGTSNEQTLLNSSRFGILESDTLSPNTWIQLNSTSLLMNLSRKSMGTDVFPVIRLSGAPEEGSGQELADLIEKAPANTKIRVGEYVFTAHAAFPETAFQPLFLLPYDPGRIEAFVDEVTPANCDQNTCVPNKIRIISNAKTKDTKRRIWLHDQAQVVLEHKEGSQTSDEPLDCFVDEGTLLCDMPQLAAQHSIKSNENSVKIRIDQAPYYDRPGIWSDTDLVKCSRGEANCTIWQPQAYVFGDWFEVRDVCADTCNEPWNWDSWEAKIDVRNLPDDAGYDIGELQKIPNTSSLSHLYAQLASQLPIGVGQQKLRSMAIQAVNSSENIIESLTTPKDKVPKSNQPQPKVSMSKDVLTVRIPFWMLPQIPENLHLLPKEGKCPPDKNCPDIILPDIRSRLLPSVLRFADLGNSRYRLEGQRLAAATGVRLDGPQSITAADFSSSFSNVDFAMPQKDASGKPLKPKPGTYNLFVVFGATSTPALQENSKGELEQIVIVVPEDKKPDSSGTNTDKPGDKANVNLDINFQAQAESQKNNNSTAVSPSSAQKKQ